MLPTPPTFSTRLLAISPPMIHSMSLLALSASSRPWTFRPLKPSVLPARFLSQMRRRLPPPPLSWCCVRLHRRSRTVPTTSTTSEIMASWPTFSWAKSEPLFSLSRSAASTMAIPATCCCATPPTAHSRSMTLRTTTSQVPLRWARWDWTFRSWLSAISVASPAKPTCCCATIPARSRSTTSATIGSPTPSPWAW